MSRILLVCSSGGHLDQLTLLLPVLDKHEIAFATFNKPDTAGKLVGVKVFPVAWPTNRSVVNLFKNFWRAWRCMREFRPELILSSGAGAAVPFFIVGRVLFNTKNIYLECYDRIDSPTLTAKLVRPFTHLFIAQWDTQLRDWPNRVMLGPSR